MISHNPKGFSLVELSIVLVILGLLVGGILSGQSLVRAAELRAVTTEYNRYITSVYTFRDKYFALPGDFTNAVSLWGPAAAGVACATTQGTGTQTCDGDGDNLIEHEVGNPNSSEQFRFWQHLANAGLIEGTYSGIAGSTGNIDHAVGGTNTPRSKLKNAIWAERYINGGTWENNVHWLILGAQTATNLPSGAILKAEESWNIDSKIDDGRPGAGRVQSYTNNANCVTTNVASTAQYTLSDSSTACMFLFKYL